ncbi:hypothetical protein JCM10908_001104 [Rhodotorula pacifica]|uniref:uncharacterized protein n=1 Tax=Rhodotorula pacifica TaxID=1495444 RepID=UPI003177044B
MADQSKPALLERIPPAAGEEDVGHQQPPSGAAPPAPAPPRVVTFPPLPRQQPQASTSATSGAAPKMIRTRSGLGTVDAQVYGVVCVGFDHTLGPNIEFAYPDQLAHNHDLNKNLPFLALPDGAHARDEDYSYFHLLVPTLAPDRTIFGISCNRQIPANQLLRKGKEVTRSTVQKAIVILASKPVFGALRDKLGVVTRSFFAQRNFDDKSILVDLFNSFQAAAKAAAESAQLKREEREQRELEEEAREEEERQRERKAAVDRKGKGRATDADTGGDGAGDGHGDGGAGAGDGSPGVLAQSSNDSDSASPAPVPSSSPSPPPTTTPFDRASQPPVSPRTRTSRLNSAESASASASRRQRFRSSTNSTDKEPRGSEPEAEPPGSPLPEEKERAAEESGEMYMGTSLRELVYRFRFKTLMLLKLLMLQRRVMFYAANTPVEQLCTFQYSLVTLIPALLTNLEDSASPTLDERSKRRKKPSSLRTSDKYSLIRYLGLPLDVFGKDSFFQPYLPLQQIDLLKTRSYLVGTTNSIFQQQRDCHIDVLVNIDSATLEILNPKLTSLVTLTAADRKWMDEIVTLVDQSWNAADPSRPLGQGFVGSDDFIRAKFEEYVCSLLACVKFGEFLSKERGERVEMLLSAPELESYNPSSFNEAFIKAFKHTAAYESWDRMTDEVIFDLVEPKHPMEGKTNPIEDVGIRLVHGLHDSLQDVTLPNLSQLPGNLNLQNINLAPLPMKARERLSKGWNSGWEAMEQLREDWGRRVSNGSLGEQDPFAAAAAAGTASPTAAQNGVDHPAEAPLGSPSLPQSPRVGQSFLAGVDVAKTGAATLATGIGSFFGAQARKTSFFGNNGGGTVPTRAGLASAAPVSESNTLSAPSAQPAMSTSPGGTTSFLRPLSTAAAATVQASPPSRSSSPVATKTVVPSSAPISPSPSTSAAEKPSRPPAPLGVSGFFGGLRRTLSPGPGEPASAPSTPGTVSTTGESGFGTPPLSSFLGVGGWGASASTSRRPTPEHIQAPPAPPVRARDIMGDLDGRGESDEDEEELDQASAERERELTRRKLEGL